MDNEVELRLEALVAALQTDFHGNIGNLINTANGIYNWLQTGSFNSGS